MRQGTCNKQVLSQKIQATSSAEVESAIARADFSGNAATVIGYGFMGKAHSNACRKVNYFYEGLGHRPVLKCLCARKKEKAQAFADNWGYESVETDWQKVT